MSIDKTWHMANTEEEIKITEFELQLWRTYYVFTRWQEECGKLATQHELSTEELIVLHMIRMKERPKTISDISRLLNRDNFFSINYNVAKLLKLGLIEKIDGIKKQYQYAVSKKGIEYTDAYTQARKNILVKEFGKELENIQFEDLTKGLMKLKGIYEEATRVASSYQPVQENQKSSKKNKKPS